MADVVPPPEGVLRGEASCSPGNPAIVYLEPREGQVVAELGCEHACYLVGLAGRVGSRGRLIAVGWLAPELEQTRHALRAAGVENAGVFLGAPGKLPLKGGVADAAFNFHVPEQASGCRPLLEEAFRILKPGGRIALSTRPGSRIQPDWRKLALEVGFVNTPAQCRAGPSCCGPGCGTEAVICLTKPRDAVATKQTSCCSG